jgi:hypothetical protein
MSLDISMVAKVLPTSCRGQDSQVGKVGNVCRRGEEKQVAKDTEAVLS